MPDVIAGASDELIELLDKRQLVQAFIGQIVRDLDPPEQTEREHKPLCPHDLRNVPGIRLLKLGHLDRILEHFEEALHGVLPLVERANVDHEGIASHVMPVGTHASLIERTTMQRNHVDVGMPLARALAALNLERRHSAVDVRQLDERATATKVRPASLLKPAHRCSQVTMALNQIGAVLDGESDEGKLKAGIFRPDHLEAIEICLHRLGTATNGAHRAEKMLLAEGRGMQPHLANGVVVAEQQVGSTAGELARRLDIAALAGIIRHIERLMMCPRIAV